MEKKSTEQSLADSKSGNLDLKPMHLTEWLAHCVGPELLIAFGEISGKYRVTWDYLARVSTLDEFQEEEEVGSRRGG